MQNSFIHWISDLLWPHRCLGCGAYGSPLCSVCTSNLPRNPRVVRSARGVRVASADSLGEQLLSRAIWHLKYRNMPSLAAPLALWLADALAQNKETRAIIHEAPVLVPVPLHARRIRERGYNQADLLARGLAGITAMPVVMGALIRTRHTPPQVASQGRYGRLANMVGAFVARPELIAGRAVLLIDDVCTTGATLEACAYALREAGATSVAAAVLARA